MTRRIFCQLVRTFETEQETNNDNLSPRKLRVLLIQQIVPHYNVPFHERLSRLPRFDFCVAYGKERPGTFPKSELSMQLKKLVLKNLYFGSAGTFCFQTGAFSKVLNREFDLIIAEFNPRIVSNLVILALARVLGLPLIWWGHGMGHSGKEWAAKIRTALVRLGSALVTYSDQGARQVIDRGIEKEKVYVAYNAIDTSRIRYIAEQIGRKRRTSLLFVGRLIPQKRMDLLLSSFALLSQQFPDLNLCIIGDGPELATLRKMAVELRISHRCVFPGGIYEENKLAPFFLSAYLFVNPGPVGLGLVHAFAYGVPVVTHRGAPHHPEVEYLVEGYNGLFFESDTPVDLAMFLARVLTDRELLDSLAAGAADTARSISLDRMVDGFISAINYATRTRGISQL
jgi:glycosyltransferase involved in cell wall biosynthesis